jgi:BirA family biotin operon repressor/biotin-[acetyl-CoA-carboxylase] ligase
VLHALDEVRSTNDEARALAVGGAPEGTAVLAKRQTAGRGRAGRSFLSPEGGLYLSVVLRPAAPLHHWTILALAAGAVVATDLRGRGLLAHLKWPNDILLDEAKVGGVLAESRMGPEPYVVVGVGLNLGGAPSIPGVGGLLAMQVRALCSTIGRAVEWDEKKGVARDVDEDGSLVVETAAGLERIVAGDVAVRFRPR